MLKLALTLFALSAGTKASAPNPPITSPTRIHPLDESQSICLDVRGGVFANGTPVQLHVYLFHCNQTPAQTWVLNSGQTKIQVNGTNFCLDAGSAPANGVGLKIWECFDNLPAQEWFATNDFRIALFNQGFCLDDPNGNMADGTQMQIWECTDNDLNQTWFTLLN